MRSLQLLHRTTWIAQGSEAAVTASSRRCFLPRQSIARWCGNDSSVAAAHNRPFAVPQDRYQGDCGFRARQFPTGWFPATVKSAHNNNINNKTMEMAMAMAIQRRAFRAGIVSPDKTPEAPSEATPLDAEAFQSALYSIILEMADSLATDGYYTTTTENGEIIPMSTITTLRNQSEELRFDHGRFEPSYSETIDESTGVVKERFDKKGVYACEPDGRDYYDATDLITYMSLLLQTLPEGLNEVWGRSAPSGARGSPPPPSLSSESFNAKLAVTEHGGHGYPLHVDNPQGIASGDTRKLTCILYLNPDHEEGTDGGEIRLYLPPEETQAEASDTECPWRTVDLSPIGGRLLVFWSDEIPHEVLPTSSSFSSFTAENGGGSDSDNDSSSSFRDKDRYALTIWIPTSDVAALHNTSSRFRDLKDLVFAGSSQAPKGTERQ